MKVRGTCRAMFAYDIAFAIDLEAAAVRLPSLPDRVHLRHRGRESPLAAGSVPLRLTQRGESLRIGVHATVPDIEITLYEFGAVCVSYAIPFEADLAELPGLSTALYGNQALLTDSLGRAEALLSLLDGALDKPSVSPLVEDYVAFHLNPSGLDSRPGALWEEHGETLASILRAETARLSPEEVQDALVIRLSYGDSDAVIADWFAAMLVGEAMEDELALLEFATVELLEMRNLDRQLDQGLDHAYALLAAPARFAWAPARFEEVYRVARLQADAALVFEGASNPAKLLGDQYLARMYRLLARRFHLPEWQEAVDRKLAILDSVYQKLADRATARRLEVLEWIIIILIALSIALVFVPGL